MYSSVLIFVDDPDVIKINEFICNHYRDIDEIVLSYVVSILQDLADMSDEESFDVDAFVETIVAYMPVTEVIPADEITEWMFALAKEQREKNARKNKHQIDLKSVIEETIQKSQQQRKISESNSIEMNLETTDKKSGSRISESSDPDPDCTYLEQSDEQVDQLMEMFPSVCTSEISHCLNLMSGDIEKAAQLIIHRQESGQCLQQKQDRVKSKFGRKNGQKQPDDKSIKRGIMDKYGFVDQADDERYHRPTLKREVRLMKLHLFIENKLTFDQSSPKTADFSTKFCLFKVLSTNFKKVKSKKKH